MSIVLSLMAFGLTAPAQAAGDSAASQTARIAAGSGASNLGSAAQTRLGDGPGKACQTGNLRTLQRCADTGTQQFSEGGCGFMQRCLFFNRTEQTYLISGAKWVVQAALCAAGLGLTCVFIGGLVELAAQWLTNRGGICPTSKPRLRVQWFPIPQVEGCVA